MSLIDKVKALPLDQIFRIFFPSVELKKEGRRLAGLCPLHSENTPSFKIDPAKNRWRCYGSADCGGGSSIDLIMKAGLASSPIEAAKLIADKFRIAFEDQKMKASGGLTVEELASAKKLPVQFLKDLGVRNCRYDGKPAIVIIYYDENNQQAVIRYRLKLKGKNIFRSKSGERQALYGLNRLKGIREKKWVLLVEGESDSWTGWYHDLPVMGVPGKNNWKSEWKECLKGLDIFVWEEPQARDFILSIAKDLPDTRVIIAPEGIKDLSQAHIHGKNIPAFIEALRVRAIPASKLRPDGTQEIPEELANRVIHPALHIEKEFASVGIITREKITDTFQILTKDGLYPAAWLKDNLTVKPLVYPELSSRWTEAESVPSLSEAIALLVSKTRELIALEDARWYSALALWASGTYIYLVFPAYPYLNLLGEKGSGKTKIEDFMEAVAFNALRIVDPTPAVLFRVVHSLRPTLLIDEFEKLSSDDSREVRQIINAGYKRGATVPRCEGDSHELKFFEVYSPKVLAAIRPLI